VSKRSDAARYGGPGCDLCGSPTRETPNGTIEYRGKRYKRRCPKHSKVGRDRKAQVGLDRRRVSKTTPLSPADGKWGASNLPLAPPGMREALGDTPLTGRAARALGFGSTWGELDAGAWARVKCEPDLMLRFLAEALQGLAGSVAMRTLAGLPAFSEDWPADLDPESVPFRVRSRNALRRGGIWTPTKLTHLSIGNIINLPAAGTFTLLDIMVTGDAAIEGHIPPALSMPSLLHLSEESWTAQVDGADPRFRDVLSRFGRKSVRQLSTGNRFEQRELERLLNDLEARVAHIQGLRLDEAIAEYVGAAMKHDPHARRVQALLKRLGITGEAPWTLQEAGDFAGLTRERIRQLEKKVLKTIASRLEQPFLPQLDRALEIATEGVPIDQPSFQELLRQEDLTSEAFSAASLLRAASLFGRTVFISTLALDHDTLILADSGLDERSAKLAVHRGRAQSRRYGASHVDALADEMLEVDQISLSPETLVAILKSEAGRVLDDGWFWFEGDKRNRLIIAARHMLAVQSPLTAKNLREGLRRRLTFRGFSVIPPIEVVSAELAGHPDFRVSSDQMIESLIPLDCETVLGPVTYHMIRILRSAPNQLMDRVGFLQACAKEDINLATATIWLTYGDVIERIAPGVFAPIGTQVGPGTVVAFREHLERSRNTSVERNSGWNGDGSLWMALEVSGNFWSSGVTGIPAAILRILRGHRLAAFSPSGESFGHIVIDDSSASWGWLTFLRRTDVSVGDVVRAKFDLTRSRVVLEAGGAELLQDEPTPNPAPPSIGP
jgi:hypothetical protein